jgi:hypothetical protein
MRCALHLFVFSLSVLLFIPAPGFSNLLPPNDFSCNAAFITLPTPDPCPAFDVDSLSMTFDNTGATSDSIQPAFFNCQTNNSTPFITADIWYAFSATAENLDIFIQGLNNPCVTLYAYLNGCKTLIPVDCAKSVLSGVVIGNFKNLIPGNVYFLQFSGGSLSDVGQFQVNFYVKRDCSECMMNSFLVPTPRR